MTIPEKIAAVDTEMAKLEEERTMIKVKLRGLAARRDQLVAQQELMDMPAEKRNQLILAAKSILSEEKVGNPG